MSNLHLSAPSSHLTVSSPMGGKRRWHIKTVATIITTLLTTVLMCQRLFPPIGLDTVK